MCLTACAEKPVQPILQPPAIRTVAVYRDLPPEMLAECPKTPWRRSDIKRDVDVVGRLAIETERADCNAGKLADIARNQRETNHDPR
jgi:hypothetical protein